MFKRFFSFCSYHVENKISSNYKDYIIDVGHAVAQLVEVLRYKPEGRGFDFRWCHLNFSLT